MKIKNEKKLKRFIYVLDNFNIVICFAAGVFCISQDNLLASCGWLCACLAYTNLKSMTMRCNDWENLGGRFVDLLSSLFGKGGVGIEVHRLNNDKDGKELKDEESKKNLPDFAPEAAESFHECAKEFFHYVEEGNREFSVSHGGVTVSMSIPEDEPMLDKVEVAKGLENGAAEQKNAPC